MDSALVTRLARPDDLDRLTAFAREASGVLIPPSYWRWKYLENPFGRSGVVLVEEGDRLVGTMSSFAIPFRWKGQDLVSGQLGYNEILESYRSRNAYFLLSTAVFQELLEDKGLDFCFGVAIDETRDLSTVLMGFEDLGRISKLVRIINPVPHLRKRVGLQFPRWMGAPISAALPVRLRRSLSGLKVEPLGRFGAAHDALWAESTSERLLVSRSASYLQWRYLDCPLKNYVAQELYSGSTLLGWAVYHTFQQGGVLYGVLDDCLGNEESPECYAKLVNMVTLALLEQRVDALVAWAVPSSSLHAALESGGFLKRHSPRSLIALGFSERVPPSVLASATNWFYTVGDGDYWLFPVQEEASRSISGRLRL